MESRREKLLKRVLGRLNGRDANKSKTDPRKEAPRVTFWSLPREIRDRIYVELLYNPVKPLTIGFDKLQLARKGVWQPVRPSIRGFYRPVIHVHRANPRWEHQSELHDEMAIFEVAEEARSTFLRSHVLLEVTSSQTAAISEWEQKLGDAAVETLQKLHIKSSIDVTVTGTFGPKLAEYQRSVIDKPHYSDPSFEGPALCVEIREEAKKSFF